MEKGISLYNITNRFIELFEKAEEGELTQEEISEQGNELALALQNKSVSIIGYARNMESLIEAMKLEEKRISDNRKAIESRYDRFKEYVKTNMEELGLEKIQNELGTLAVRKNPASVEVYDEMLIADEYKKKKVTVTIDKTAIKEAIKSGINVQGAILVEDKTGLRIK